MVQKRYEELPGNLAIQRVSAKVSTNELASQIAQILSTRNAFKIVKYTHKRMESVLPRPEVDQNAKDAYTFQFGYNVGITLVHDPVLRLVVS